MGDQDDHHFVSAKNGFPLCDINGSECSMGNMCFTCREHINFHDERLPINKMNLLRDIRSKKRREEWYLKKRNGVPPLSRKKIGKGIGPRKVA